MKTKTVKSGNNIYYCTAKGVMEAWKKGNVYYNSKGKKMTAAQAYDYETLQRAKQIVSQMHALLHTWQRHWDIKMYMLV